MNAEKIIKITFQQGFQDELNMSAEKYYNYQNSNNIKDLRYALKSKGDACNQGLLFLLKMSELPIYEKNSHTIKIHDCISLLETKLQTKVTHKKEFCELIEIRNKLVHNELEITIQSAINTLDKAFYSLGIVFDEHDIDILQYIDNQEHRIFMKKRESYYRNEVLKNNVYLNKDNYLDISTSVHNCPFCGEEKSFYLMCDETKYRCALCEVEDDPANCSECTKTCPNSLLLDFCDGYENLCDNCYNYHDDKSNG